MTGAPESEPDARFTLANERTLLAWTRTALALLAAGLAAQQFLPATPLGVDRRLIGFPLLLAAAVVGLGAYPQWRRTDRALRTAQPLPSSPVPAIAAILVGVVAAVAAVAGALR